MAGETQVYVIYVQWWCDSWHSCHVRRSSGGSRWRRHAARGPAGEINLQVAIHAVSGAVKYCSVGLVAYFSVG